jgi:uncharacterized protein (TIGR02145 family)
MRSLLNLEVLIIVILLSSLHSCKKEELPTLSTSSITNIKATSATGGGMITSDGNASVTSRGICWGLNTNPTLTDSKTNDGTGEGQFVSSLTGLSAGSTYHVRAYATNSVGTAYGADLSFATLGKAPECLTQAATNITSSGATLNGTVNANHLSTNVTFEYGTSTSYGQSLTSAQNPITGNSITNVSADLSGLTPGTTYHYRVVAVNSIGTTNGNDLTFTTVSILPTLTTSTVSNKTAISVTSGGTITSDGGASITSRGVCWATTPNPTILNNKTSDGTGTGTFTSNITGLTPGMSYYVRAYATNTSGTAYGDELSFTTLATIPTLTTASITDKTRTTATSGGNVLSDGGSAVTARGVCWSPAPNPTADGFHTNNGTGTGIFTSNLTSLTPGTTYHVRAFATNSAGTAYGNEVSFPTNPYELATINTYPAISLTENIAASGGNITSDGGSQITARGVCWSTNPYPTIGGPHTVDSNGAGSFSSDLRCLYDATIYYVRAYATNAAGIAYGNQQNFVTKNDPITFNPTKAYGMVSDIDENCYKTIQIGNETWMAENLKTSRYNDGTPIPNVTDNTEWGNLLTVFYTTGGERTFEIVGAFCWFNNDSSTYNKDYGKLYNFGAVETGKLCPVGWHVPTYGELSILFDQYLGPLPPPWGYGLMETGSNHWNEPLGSNQSGFSAIPGGFGGGNSFFEIGITSSFWSSDRGSPSYGTQSMYRQIPFYPLSSPLQQLRSASTGLSIRCIKN